MDQKVRQNIEKRYADTSKPTPNEAQKRELEKSSELADAGKFANSPNSTGKADPNKPYEDPIKFVARSAANKDVDGPDYKQTVVSSPAENLVVKNDALIAKGKTPEQIAKATVRA